MSESEEVYVVQMGDYWLQTKSNDDSDELRAWVLSLSHATHHSKEWAEEFVASRPAGLAAKLLTLSEAIRQEHEYAMNRIKKRWLNAFETRVRGTYQGFSTDGMWTVAHMYYGQGLSLSQAVEAFGGPGGPRCTRRSGA